MDLPGYAIGGLAVGEPGEVTREMIARTLEVLPKDKPRYVMGVGDPDEIEEYARMGVDMMDCVLPTRAGRQGLLFTSEGRLNITKLGVFDARVDYSVQNHDNRVPHLRRGFIAPEVGHRAKHDPSLFVRAGISGLGQAHPEDSDSNWTNASLQVSPRGLVQRDCGACTST